MTNAQQLLICAITLFVMSGTLGRQPSPSCSLQLDRGPCNNYTAKWYYDCYSKQCRSFYYGGCQGNANRFNSLEECKATCDREEDNPAVKRCFKPFDRGTCNGNVNKWYYDSRSHDCLCGTWGGCGGNDNLFKSYQDCFSSCGQFIPKTGKSPKTNNDCPIHNVQASNKSLSSKSNANWMKLFPRPRTQHFNDRKLGEIYSNISAVNRYSPPSGSMQRQLPQQRRLPPTRLQQNNYPKSAVNSYQSKLINSNKNRSYPPAPNTSSNNARTATQLTKPNAPNYQHSQPLPAYLTNYLQPGHSAPKYPPHAASIHISPNHQLKTAPSSSKHPNQWSWKNGHHMHSTPPTTDTRYGVSINSNRYAPNFLSKLNNNRTLPNSARDPLTKTHDNYLAQQYKFRIAQKPTKLAAKKPTNHSLQAQRYNVNQNIAQVPLLMPKPSEPSRTTLQLDPTYAPIYPTYPPSHLYIPQEPYSAPLSPFAKQLPKYPPTPSYPQHSRAYNKTENLVSLKQSYQEQDGNKGQKLNEYENREREQRKKLKKDSLFAKLKQQEMERWYQMRRNYLRNGKPLLPQNVWSKSTTPAHYDNSIIKVTNGMNAALQPVPTTMAPTITNAGIIPDTNLQHPNTLIDGNEVKPNAKNDDSFSEEYDEGAETYDDPLQFFLRMKQPNKSGAQEVDTTESDGYAYADEETDNNWMETDLRPNTE